MRVFLSLSILLTSLERISETYGAFIPRPTSSGTIRADTFTVPTHQPRRKWGKSSFSFITQNDFSISSSSKLYAKPKRVTSDVALDLDEMDDEPMSLKDQLKAKKEAEKNAKKSVDKNNNSKNDVTPISVSQLDSFDDDEPMSMKDKMKLQKQTEKANKKGKVDLLLEDDEHLSLKDKLKAQKEAEKATKKITQGGITGKKNSDIDFLDIDEPLSMKEKMKLQKEAERNDKKATKHHEEIKQEERMESTPSIQIKMEDTTISPPPSTISNGNQDAKSKALKALELMERVEAQENKMIEQPKLSKKELKELEKKAAKKAMKEAKKGTKIDSMEDDEDSGDVIEESSVSEVVLEVRKLI